MAPRFTGHGGNFFTDTLPGDSDCVTLVRVLCDHNDEPALNLLKNIRRSIHRDATLVIGEPMDRPDAGGSLAAAYFGLYFLAMQSGACRSPQQVTALLETAGFGSIKRVATRNPLFASVLTAKPLSKV